MIVWSESALQRSEMSGKEFLAIRLTSPIQSTAQPPSRGQETTDEAIARYVAMFEAARCKPQLSGQAPVRMDL